MITETAQVVLEKRYFIGGETEWGELTDRVANCFAKNDYEFDVFKDLMDNMDFLPNSPALMNAGTPIHAYSACYVLPIEDSIESIYKFYSDAAIISKSGGGVGANYSSIRGKDRKVQSTDGVASGPLSFMTVQDVSTDVIKQGGRRRGANMAILNCDHPDFEDFIHVKEDPTKLKNFNLSVWLTDEFMEGATCSPNGINNSWENEQWNVICQKAWEGAEPGVLFGDTIQRGNPVPELGGIEATNPCGEQPLLPYENCCLGSINLSNMVKYTDAYVGDDKKHRTIQTVCTIDWRKIEDIACNSVLFLNRILDASELPIPECQEAMEKSRKIGLGIMGLHDMLIQLGIPYDSERGRTVASEVMEYISAAANGYSTELAKRAGTYGGYKKGMPFRRNACLTTIAPTGTLSMIADCSSGCEPYYSMVTHKNVLDGESLVLNNKWYDPQGDSVLFKGAMDISPVDHVKMQAALQKYVDSSISKTINMPKEATVEDVKEVLQLAWELGCKGVTVYRDGCRAGQILNTTASSPAPDVQEDTVIEWRDPIKLDLPDVLNAKRYRIRDKEGHKAYLIVCHDEDGIPMEIFHKQPFKENDTLWATVCRQASLALRYGVPTNEVIKQLDKSSYSMTDLPAQLSRILKTYLSSGDAGYTIPCPDCDGDLVYQGGCCSCPDCGYSKCS